MIVLKSVTDEAVVDKLRSGAVGVLPTDTLYGLVCAASNKESVARLYTLKNRDKEPGTLVAANIDQLTGLGIPRRYLTAVEQFWPGSVSIEIASHPSLNYLDLGSFRLAVRIPSDPQVQGLLKQTGPLMTTSANLPGDPPATTIAQAQEIFGDKLDFYVVDGDLSNRQPSTLIRIVDDELQVVRQGAVQFNDKGEIT